MSRIFLHIGLPKTATTTLQTDIFPYLNEGNIKYVGVRQPRSAEQNPLYKIIYGAIRNGENIKVVRNEIITILKSDMSLLLSEEMIVVSEPQVNWHVKLKNLSNLVYGLDYTLIVTVREPVSAMFSYYVELYSQCSKEKKSFEELALRDQRMEIFHYEKFFHVISSLFDISQVFVKKFEEVIVGDVVDLYRLFGVQDKMENIASISKHNSKKSANGYVYTKKKLNISCVMRNLLSRTGIADFYFINALKKNVRPLMATLDNLSIGVTKMAKPSDKEFEDLRLHMKKETAAIDRLFGIKYE